ncbi:Oligopeptide/dipeptide transporter, C-terminal region [Amycolatopsis tolypomycina]|uniref:Oligopeptide/dipeptide transporter, C-terminal region n=1 Tax=Amycolatopsis tolypomycina TaxID=208445 RepID=A0A1H4ZAA3_9PSEU|nr:ATP-binding cassette domain-containing protein [Amycolatopsis tolypomycina]SED27043.1 Oligopeptide/dipeptide transporter, C-terminal region [Amycolatopsis tolypomycina]
MTAVTHRDLVLDVTGLGKTFHSRAGGAHEALRDVSFSVERGSCLAVVGESGSGKTTAARIVAGLETATEGSVELASAGSGCGVQMVFQDPYGSLDPRQAIGAGLHELLRVHGMRRKADRADRVAELLDSVGLDERHTAHHPRSLSGGQCQRVAIARALALEPTLLILDEAVSALDVSVQAQVLNLLADIRERTRITYLFVSHDLGVVRQVSDTCVVLRKGQIVEQGRTIDVLDSPQQPYTQALVDAVPRPGWQPRRRSG